MQNHSRRLLLAGLIASAASPAFAQQGAQPFFGQLTQAEAARGLREALSLAATNATHLLGQPSGFWSDLEVRIPLPGLLGDSQRTLSRFGMSGPLDNLQQNLNAAAAATMPRAPACSWMRCAPSPSPMRSPSCAAAPTAPNSCAGAQTQLANLLKPVMRDALTQSGAFTYARAAQVGLAGMTTQLRTEVTDFSTLKALDGCFQYIAKEERAIAAILCGTSDTLRRVFG